MFDAGRHGHDARHARGLRAVPVPRPHGRLPDAAERDRLANVTSGGGQVPAFVVEPTESHSQRPDC